MTVFAVFMCMMHLPAGEPPRCILMTAQAGVSGLSGRPLPMTSLAQCERVRRRYVGGEMPGWRFVCLKQTVPAWEPAQ